ncbi:hypothetical protein [Arthrobacter glacialis]|uniref:hypothetical protein n=1 Tax=Arthrobacter glacialis TaxID=1664 RepID=UPI0010572398|nr:hypothetical protein [Arthrobacter glacialis]
MNKFDPDSTEIMLAIIEAEARHPDPGDGPVTRFSIWAKPWVKVGDVYGRAAAYTHSYGLVAWWDETKTHHLEWFPANQIKRVARSDWHGY